MVLPTELTGSLIKAYNLSLVLFCKFSVLNVLLYQSNLSTEFCFKIYHGIIKLLAVRRDKMVKEYVDVEHVSLHECIRNTPSDAENLKEHRLKWAKSLTIGENIDSHKTC